MLKSEGRGGETRGSPLRCQSPWFLFVLQRGRQRMGAMLVLIQFACGRLILEHPYGLATGVARIGEPVSRLRGTRIGDLAIGLHDGSL
eukprot:scaffold239817_cov35-Tisochrysis_lutea.AAC.2